MSESATSVNRHPWLSLVALSATELPDPSKVASRMVDGDAPAAEVSTQSPNMTVLAWGDAVAAYTLVPEPIAREKIEGPAACAWYWPEAPYALANHKAHLLVALVDESTGLVHRALRFTQFVAAVLRESPSIGLQWGNSRAVHEAEAFCLLAEKATLDDLPLHLWIDFRCETSEVPGALQLFTTGLRALGQPELEVRQFVGDAQTLIGHAYNVAHYMLSQQKALRDGEALGLADETQVTLREGPSMLGDGEEVVEMVFE